MSIEITPEQGSALAYILCQIRKDWDQQSVKALLGKNRIVPSYGELVQAAVTKARQEHVKTPALIFTEGDHWPKPNRMKLPTAPKCEDHPTEVAEHCHCCWADIKIGDRPEHMLGKRFDTEPAMPMTDEQKRVARENIKAAIEKMKNNPATLNEGGHSFATNQEDQ